MRPPSALRKRSLHPGSDTAYDFLLRPPTTASSGRFLCHEVPLSANIARLIPPWRPFFAPFSASSQKSDGKSANAAWCPPRRADRGSSRSAESFRSPTSIYYEQKAREADPSPSLRARGPPTTHSVRRSSAPEATGPPSPCGTPTMISMSSCTGQTWEWECGRWTR